MLHEEICHGVEKFIRKFLNENWSPSSLNKLLTKTDQTSTADCKPGSGNKRKMWIAQNGD